MACHYISDIYFKGAYFENFKQNIQNFGGNKRYRSFPEYKLSFPAVKK